MNIENREVNEVESPTTDSQEVVNEEPLQNAPEAASQETDIQAQETVQTPQKSFDPSLYDERGVPWKNVAMENNRKLEDILRRVDERLQVPQQPTERKYTIAELEAFAQDDPKNRPWVEEKKAEIIRDQTLAAMNAQLKATTQAQEASAAKARAEAYVAQTYPEVFMKDQFGRVVDWNLSHPLTRELSVLMSDPALQADPRGLALAADAAYGRYMRTQGSSANKQMKQLKAQVKKVQQQTFVEGGGRRVTETVPTVRKAVEATRGGDQTSAKNAMREILKASGRIKE